MTCARCKWEGVFGDPACPCGLEFLVFGEPEARFRKTDKIVLRSNTFIIDPLHELGMMAYDRSATNLGSVKVS